MIKTNILISINVHEKIDYLINQINNIIEFVKLDFIIIINPNKFMYDEIKNHNFFKNKDNIIVNPNFIEKKRFHGSLLNGIYLNMEYALKKIMFDYFLILSSRNFFYNIIDENKILLFDSNNKKNEATLVNTTHPQWHWGDFLETKLSKYVIKNNLLFSNSAHEGLTFDYISCKKIYEFLETNYEIKNELFNWHNCVEEFAFQTICINVTGYYYYIGNGWETNNNIYQLPSINYVYKKERFSNINENKFINIIGILYFIFFIVNIYFLMIK